MAAIQRGVGHRSGVINSDIEAVWKVITDWGDLSWLDNEVDHDGMQLGSLVLEGDPGSVPRTRLMIRANTEGTGLGHTNREVLLLEDPVAHRIYYDADDDFLPSVRNYVATWALDPIDGASCRMTIDANFDVGEGNTAEAVQTIVEDVYDMILRSLDNHFRKERGPVSA